MIRSCRFCDVLVDDRFVDGQKGLKLDELKYQIKKMCQKNKTEHRNDNENGRDWNIMEQTIFSSTAFTVSVAMLFQLFYNKILCNFRWQMIEWMTDELKKCKLILNFLCD